MKLQYDRIITISVGNSRKDLNWKQQVLTVSDLYERLRKPQRSPETLDAYLKLPKSKRDDLKDIGGFVGGTINGGRRKAANIVSRDVITLDFDTIPAYGADGVIDAVDKLGCGYCVYSTRKHLKTAPRLRIIIPLDRSVGPEEYEAIARKLASFIGIQMADPTTFEPHRMMYWGSCCVDGEYIFKYADKDLCPADGVLANYTNWKDWNEWPQVPGAINYKKLAVKQGDPEDKPGVVGAFCRTYSVRDAMDKFLPGIYTQTDTDPNRFTYTGGSTAGGAILYDNDKFLFSHHATDPCGGRLVNAFDLVRLHKFGDEDNDAPYGAPTNKLPSFGKMCDLANADAAVCARLIQDRTDAAFADFSPIFTPDGSGPDDGSVVAREATEATRGEMTEAGSGSSTTTSTDKDWMKKLATNGKGGIRSTIDNIFIILENDPFLRGRVGFNEFAGRGEVFGQLPWARASKRRLWTDTDSDGLYWYLEKYYGITNRGSIDSALSISMDKHSLNEVQDYLRGLTWDGTPRLDTLFCDYLGAEDSEYTRTVCRKAFVAAVTRAMEPAAKYDNMVILCGPQGIGKSTLLDKMSRGWFNDSIRTFEGKEASELLAGVWIVEVAELDAFKRSDVSRIKQFLSLRSDRYRAAYGRHMSELPRRCVFFGTCNQMEFLQDTTGNRRFLPVDVGVEPHDKNVFEDLTDEVIDQLWAEAKVRWQLGEGLFLSGEVEEAAVARQEEHREQSPREGDILDFIAQQIPVDWDLWTIDQRRDYWCGNYVAGGKDLQLKDRETICAMEIWCELYGKSRADLTRNDSREINGIIAHTGEWEPMKGNRVTFWPPYGRQRGFRRKPQKGLLRGH